MIFADRRDAGTRLAAALARFEDEHPLILALPRGGVPVAAEVARALHAPLEVLIVRKIGLPEQPELAMGAVIDGDQPVTVRNEEVIGLGGVSEATFAAVRDRELAEIRRRRALYFGDRPQPDVRGRTVIVIDDGIATGATVRAALRGLRRRRPKRLVLAVPVAASSTLAALEEEADEIVCLESRPDLAAIGYYYADFAQVPDNAVIEMLAAARPGEPSKD
jgi:predicted phosphoribosyltransferase